MGYRSTMILGIAPKYKKEFEKILKKHYPYTEPTFRLAKKGFKDDMIIYKGEHLEWYTEFDAVKEIEKLIHKASEDNDNAFIVGIGEDGVVHSEIGYYYDCVGISTTHEIY